MAQIFRQRLLEVVPYQAGVKVPRKIQSGLILRKIIARLVGTLTCTGAVNTIANVQRGDEFALINKLAIVANSTDVLREFRDADCFMLPYLKRGCGRPAIQLGAGSTLSSSITIDSPIPIDFFDRTLYRPIETALDTSGLTDLRCEVTWGSVDRPINDGTGTVNSANCSTAFTGNLELWAIESDADGGDYHKGSGHFTPTVVKPFTDTLTSTSDKRITLDTGCFYKGLWLNFTLPGSNNAGDQDVDVLGYTNSSYYPLNIKVIAGSVTVVDASGAALFFNGLDYLGDNKTQFNRGLVKPAITVTDNLGVFAPTVTPGGSTAGSGAYGRVMQSSNVDVRGWIYIPFVYDGMLSEGLDTRAASTMQVIVTPAASLSNSTGGTTNVRVIAEQYWPPPVSTKKR